MHTISFLTEDAKNLSFIFLIAPDVFLALHTSFSVPSSTIERIGLIPIKPPIFAIAGLSL